MMIEKTLSEFCKDTENLVKNTVNFDDFVKIKTESGNAMLITEDEWNLLISALKLHIARL